MAAMKVNNLKVLFLYSLLGALCSCSTNTSFQETETQKPYDDLGENSPFVNASRIEAGAAENASDLPGNSWDSILDLPQLWGGSWGVDLAGLAERIMLENVEYPPFKPEYMAQSRQRVQAILDGESDFFDASCRPWGMPRLIYYAGAISFMEQPGLIAIFTNQPRAIFMDGREHPPEFNDPDAIVRYTTIGHSTGWWEDGTLVVDTIGINPDTEIFYGVPNGGGMHIVERYRLTEDDTLDITMTVDAPVVLERPWVYHTVRVRQDDANIVGDECDPVVVRQKVDADGNLTLDLTPPP